MRLFVALSSSRFLEFEDLSLSIVAGRGQCGDAGADTTDLVPLEFIAYYGRVLIVL